MMPAATSAASPSGSPAFAAPITDRGPTALAPIEQPTIDRYLDALIHDWSKTLTMLGITLVPLFFVLDVFMMPRDLLPRFGIYRLTCVVIIVAQHMFIRLTRPSPRSFLHGYFFMLVVSFMIALMTTDLGGFNSTYYAGLNLVLIAVNLLLPWKPIHSAINSLITILMYVGLNLVIHQEQPTHGQILINNLYFLTSTGIISTSINYVKQKLIVQEFHLRTDLKAARDALWGEMEVAKHIQTALLPRMHEVPGYKVAATMLPADEVGGDYYDIIETAHGETWLCVGDVSGHGVESGLIMMMTQTSIFTVVDRDAGLKPSEVLGSVNAVLKKNISRLGADRYVTCMAIKLEPEAMTFAGKHQDVLIYRARTGTAEWITMDGVWLGIVDDIRGLLTDDRCPIEVGDVILLFTDGVTEAMNARRELFGEERLRQSLMRVASQDVDQIVNTVVKDVRAFMHKQKDDLTVVAVKRVGTPARAVAAA
ncbi:MAG: PP2C family protein-serine/threonine phosphatase [Myxococcaceae bacterium]|nr:PP2C family protein-serine/threonine phosphatase [Myxococcaceae bacterium]